MVFTISTDNNSFNQKQKNLFDQLDNAAKCNKLLPPDKMDVEEAPVIKEHLKRQKQTTRHYRRQESMFKKPEAPITQCLPIGRTPGFRKNPGKWTKYSLRDVKDEDLSDRSNTKAALSFLKELEHRKAESADCDGATSDKVVFKATAIIKGGEREEVEEKGSTFKNSKVVMPEYVVGQKVVKKRSTKAAKERSNVQLKLQHLLEEEDEDL